MKEYITIFFILLLSCLLGFTSGHIAGRMIVNYIDQSISQSEINSKVPSLDIRVQKLEEEVKMLKEKK